MEGAAAVADPPADLEQRRREAEEAEAGGVGGEQEPALEGGEGAPAGEGEPAGEEAPDLEDQGEAPGEGEGEQAKPQLAIHVGGKLNSTVGGDTPDVSTVKLKGGSVAIAGGGQLKKGETKNLLIKVKVCEVDFVDKEDRSTGEVTETERRHIAKIVGVEVVE